MISWCISYLNVKFHLNLFIIKTSSAWKLHKHTSTQTFKFTIYIFINFVYEASRGAGALIVTVKSTGCRFDPHSRKWNIYLLLYFHFFALVYTQSAALSSATQHVMPPEFGGKWGTECLNTRFLAYRIVCGIQREADLFIWFLYSIPKTDCI